MKTVFLLTHIPNPRMNKRIAVAKSIGNAEVICVQREKENIWVQHHDDVPHHIMEKDYPPSTNVFKRIMALLSFAVFSLRNLKRAKPECIYSGNLDCLMIAFWFSLWHRKTKLVFEVADLRESFLSGCSIKRKILHFVQAILYRRVSFLVVTSELFYKRYLYQFFSTNRLLVLPNIPDLSAFSSYQKKQEGPFTVGFIGGIRYLEQMKMLVEAAEAARAQVLFAGAGGTSSDMDAITAYCQGKEHVRFTGKYRYEKDIARLYGSVDCVYAVYDADNPNVRIALPNKLYESIFCELPIIVANGTYLADLVNEWKIGVSVSHLDSSDLESVLKKLKNDKAFYNTLVRNCTNVSKELMPLGNQDTLAQAILNLCAGN